MYKGRAPESNSASLFPLQPCFQSYVSGIHESCDALLCLVCRRDYIADDVRKVPISIESIREPRQHCEAHCDLHNIQGAMCGIFAIHGVQNPSQHRSRAIACSRKQRHRGPDWSGCYVGKQTVLVHERLAIVGVGEHFSFTFYVSRREVIACCSRH